MSGLLFRTKRICFSGFDMKANKFNVTITRISCELIPRQKTANVARFLAVLCARFLFFFSGGGGGGERMKVRLH